MNILIKLNEGHTHICLVQSYFHIIMRIVRNYVIVSQGERGVVVGGWGNDHASDKPVLVFC